MKSNLLDIGKAQQADLLVKVLLILPLAILIFLVGSRTGWTYTYTLDDPYIHLALAKGIHSLHYGINANELSAPSSSILWPFLFAPFAALSSFKIFPLLINLFFCGVTINNLYGFSRSSLRLSPSLAGIFVLVVVFSLNIYGVVFSGMEHSLQILLVSFIATGLGQNSYHALFWLSTCLLPAIRYEGLAISIPVLAYIALSNNSKRHQVATCLLVISIYNVAFSEFLHLNGLGILPSSVLAKNGISSAASIQEALSIFKNNFVSNLNKPMLLATLFALFVGQLTKRSRKEVVLTLYIPLILHLLLGKNGWFGRYEVYILVYILIVGLSFLAQFNNFEFIRREFNFTKLVPPLILAMLIGFPELYRCTILTPQAAKGVHDQQIQMGIISRDYIRQNIAVNDLGAVSLLSNHYVLDLWGLGSYEVLEKRKTGEPQSVWIREMMARKKVEYAFVYDSWFPEKPSNWIKVATLGSPNKRNTPGDVVTFYATNQVAAAGAKIAISRYADENPSYKPSVRIIPTSP